MTAIEPGSALELPGKVGMNTKSAASQRRKSGNHINFILAIPALVYMV
jgi:hypothetical protein